MRRRPARLERHGCVFEGSGPTGNFTTVDLSAASTKALSATPLCRRPDHCKSVVIVGVVEGG